MGMGYLNHCCPFSKRHVQVQNAPVHSNAFRVFVVQVGRHGAIPKSTTIRTNAKKVVGRRKMS